MRIGSAGMSGVTIFELMITIAVAGVLAAVAIPNMRDFIRNNRLTAAANDLLRSTQLARSEAIKQQRNVVVCATADPHATTPACSYDTFNGWIVFQDFNSNWDYDAGEIIVERHDLLDPSVTVLSDGDAILSYGPSGFANPPGTETPSTAVVICDARGNQASGTNSTARAIFIENTGRSRVSKVRTDVNEAVGRTGGSCS